MPQSTTLTRLPFPMPNSAGNSINDLYLSTLLPSQVESLASAQWYLGADNSSMTDLVAGLVLTPFATPTQGTGYVTTPHVGALSNGLLSPIPDQAELTLCMIFQHTASSLSRYIMGALSAYDSLGAEFVQNSSNVYNIGVDASGSEIVTPPPGIAVGNWAFVAMTSSALSGVSTLNWGSGGTGVSSTILSYTDPHLKPVAPRNITFGGTQNITNDTTATFNGQISGTVLTVNSLTSGTIADEQGLTGASIPSNVIISTGSGSTWNLSQNLGTIAAESMTTFGNPDAANAYGTSIAFIAVMPVALTANQIAGVYSRQKPIVAARLGGSAVVY